MQGLGTDVYLRLKHLDSKGNNNTTDSVTILQNRNVVIGTASQEANIDNIRNVMKDNNK